MKKIGMPIENINNGNDYRKIMIINFLQNMIGKLQDCDNFNCAKKELHYHCPLCTTIKNNIKSLADHFIFHCKNGSENEVRTQLEIVNIMYDLSDDNHKIINNRYIICNILGEGTYGTVFLVIDKQLREFVALKKIKLLEHETEEGLSPTTIREISILKNLNHSNIVKLLDVFFYDNETYLSFEYLKFNLKEYIDSHSRRKVPIETEVIKMVMFQLLAGIEFCHKNKIIHRDLKPQNILIENKPPNNAIIAKICDFGLAREFQMPLKAYTHEVITLWYRSPEILLGEKVYSPNVDVWSLGCIFAELILLEPIFLGESEIGQLMKIFQKIGTPSDDDLINLPNYKTLFPKWEGNNLGYYLRNLKDEDGIDLIKKMLVFNKDKRISSRDALRHKYFHSIWKRIEMANLKRKQQINNNQNQLNKSLHKFNRFNNNNNKF